MSTNPQFNNQSILKIGQRVFSSLYGGRYGVISSIHGEQAPDSVQHLSNVVATGGKAYFDIVFENGTMSKNVPEAILRGTQWRIYDEMVNSEEIDQLITNYKETYLRAEKKRQEVDEKRQNEREGLRLKYSYLKQVSNNESSSKTGASNIRKELRRVFPKTKFSVRMSGGHAIDITWKDGPTKKQVEAISDKYQEGNFNGMEDIYEKDNGNVWPDVFGGDRFVFTHRSYSDRLVQKAIDDDYREYKANYVAAGIDKPTISSFRSGGLYNVFDPKRHSGANSIQADIHARLSEYSEVEALTSSSDSPVAELDTNCSDFDVREGTRPGYVELLFKDKPGDAVRSKLKSAGFRWSRKNSLWYGKSEKLPAQFCPLEGACLH